MPVPEGLNQLAQRKRLLLAQSELQRRLLALECARLRTRLAPLESVEENLGRLRPWLLAAGAAAGLLAARRWRRLLRWLPAALAVWRWWRRMA